jgi:hypothetical protein
MNPPLFFDLLLLFLDSVVNEGADKKEAVIP